MLSQAAGAPGYPTGKGGRAGDGARTASAAGSHGKDHARSHKHRKDSFHDRFLHIILFWGLLPRYLLLLYGQNRQMEMGQNCYFLLKTVFLTKRG